MARRKEDMPHGKRLSEYTPEEMAELQQKRKDANLRKRMLRQSMAPLVAEFLLETFKTKIDGEEKKIDGATLIKLCFRRELEKGGHPAVQMLKVMNDIVQGNPKLVAQFNFNSINEKEIGTDLKEEFRKLRGSAEDAEIVENA